MAGPYNQGTTEIARGHLCGHSFDRTVRRVVAQARSAPMAFSGRFAGKPAAAQEFAWLCWQLDQLLDLPRPLTSDEDHRLMELSDRLLELLG